MTTDRQPAKDPVKEERDVLFALAQIAEDEGDKQAAQDLRREAMSYGQAW